MNPETSNELRGLVREVLRETLAKRTASKGDEAVTIASDADLQSFIERLARPGGIEAVRAGKLRFVLKPASHTPTPAPASTPLPVAGEVVEGLINEQRIDSFAGRGTLILGATAVLTPLARDKLRKLGLKVERRR